MIHTIVLLIVAHFVCDFMLQTEWQGRNKSHNPDALLSHVLEYSGAMFVCFMAIHIVQYGKVDLMLVMGALFFALITLLCHLITDYWTSKVTAAKYKTGHFYGIGGFWAAIGADQALHIIQIIYTYLLLNQ